MNEDVIGTSSRVEHDALARTSPRLFLVPIHRPAPINRVAYYLRNSVT